MNHIRITVEPTDKNGQWRVVTGFTHLGITVVPKQLTDGASIPWICRWLLKVGGPLFAPSVWHDKGYREGLRTKKEIDDGYLVAMATNKVPKWKRLLIYKAVVWFGRSSYKGNK